jgi:hypothetical protein
LVEKPRGKKELGKPRHRWEDIIRMGLKEIKCEVWIHLTQDGHQ